MTMFHLMPHPDTPPGGVRGMSVEIVRRDGKLMLTYRVDGAEQVALPDWVTSVRADDLWKTTCCELFLTAAGQAGYVEFNYSPSTRWAAYAFDGYRSGGRDLTLTVEPHVTRGDEESEVLVEVDQALGDLGDGPFAMALSAVIEETDGTRSYWALAHGAGPPDFHKRDCFVATLPAPSVP